MAHRTNQHHEADPESRHRAAGTIGAILAADAERQAGQVGRAAVLAACRVLGAAVGVAFENAHRPGAAKRLFEAMQQVGDILGRKG